MDRGLAERRETAVVPPPTAFMRSGGARHAVLLRVGALCLGPESSSLAHIGAARRPVAWR